MKTDWHQKPYYSLDAWCKNTLHHKCYKIALNAHMTCPNRDGSIDTRGCIFCSAGGSGDFAVDIRGKTIEQQLTEGLARFRDKFSLCDLSSPCLIAYFQAYTNTYAPVSYLRRVYTQALDCPAVCGISIATRPDCLPCEVLELLSELKKLYPDKFIWVELGLQTIRESTADFIRRGYPLSCFEEGFQNLKKRNIPVIVHLILGLPGEALEDVLAAVNYLNQLMPFGVKLQLLHYLKNTDLGRLYLESETIPEQASQAAPEKVLVKVLKKEEYVDWVIECIRSLSPEIVLHRITGDGPKDLLLAPLWSLHKKDVYNSIHRQMKYLSAKQGDHYQIP